MPVRGSPNLSLELAIKHLTRAIMMRDPMSKDVCAVKMCVAALRIEEELERYSSTTAKARFVNAHPDLLRAGMHFLTSTAGLAEAINLKEHLYRCKCDRDLDDFIDLHFVVHWLRDLPEGVTIGNLGLKLVLLYAAVHVVSNCLVLSLSKLTQHKYRSEHCESPGDGRTLKWPQGPDDLFPNGLAQAYKGLECWVADSGALQAQHFWEGYVPVEYNICQLICQLVVYHEPFAFSLLNFPKLMIVFVGIKTCRQEAGLLHKAGKLKAFERVLRVVLDFYDAIEEYDHVQFRAIMEHPGKILQNWWLELNDVLAARPEWNKLHRRVYRLAVFATNGLYDEVGYQRLMGPLDDWIIKPKLTEVDRLEDAFSIIVRTRKAGCLNARCTPSNIAAQNRLCSKCKVVRYCGERCQKQAWKSSVVPHKDLCAMVESLKEATGVANWARMWKPGFTFAAFHSMMKDKPAAADLLISIGDTMSKVIALKSEKRKVYVQAMQSSAEYAMQERAFVAEMIDMAEVTGLNARLDKGPIRLTKLTHPVL